MNNKKIGIVIPVFNACAYLNRCIDSVLAQTYRDIIVVLVDDGSTDNSSQICDRYAEIDYRINVIHQTNKGQTAARKAGLERLQGIEFITFIDADDWVSETYVENLACAQQKDNSDVVIGSAVVVNGNSTSTLSHGIKFGKYEKIDVINNMMCMSGTFLQPGINPTIWNVLFRLKSVQKAIFQIDEKIRIGEDAALLYSLILTSNNISIVETYDYYYRIHPDSISHSRQKNEIEQNVSLLKHLRGGFQKYYDSDEVRREFNQYTKYLLLRSIDYLLANKINPYDVDLQNKKVIIYGAGACGLSLADYISAQENISLVSIVDKNYENIKYKSFKIESPEIINEKAYDLILIAAIQQNVAKSIYKYLTNRVKNIDKIRLFTEEFLDERYSIDLI